ncbi:MAG: ABC transporter permease, partial [Alphaproteobacteria bacterium]|nr:ABC transporter permease [Alphaproteobacteria bacterium]
ALTRTDPAGSGVASDRAGLGYGAAVFLFWLNMLLANMMLSNLVEEKSNKIMEVLIAALRVDAIFLGKLIAMVGTALTIVTAYVGLGTIGYLLFAPPELALPVPAIGWPLFIVLGYAYFIMNYMVVGGIFIGIGAQASSPREVQTISMPVTMAQMLVLLFASTAIKTHEGWQWWLGALFPPSSPLVMYNQAAISAKLWPHLLTLGWLMLCAALVIRFAAARFRKYVLKSGPAREKRRGLLRAQWTKRATTSR